MIPGIYDIRVLNWKPPFKELEITNLHPELENSNNVNFLIHLFAQFAYRIFLKHFMIHFFNVNNC